MSNAVFPTLPGLGWNIVRSPIFVNRRQRSVSGREVAFSYQQYPLTQFSLNYELLRDNATYPELGTLTGFYLARQGSFDSFLFTDPADQSVTDAGFGTGDGTTTQFQLVRPYGAGGFTYAEPVQSVNALTNIKVGGVVKTLTTDYSIDANGLVTFVAAPAAAAALTWTGTYYYRCRFTHDQADFTTFLSNYWSAKKIEFVGAVGNRV